MRIELDKILQCGLRVQLYLRFLVFVQCIFFTVQRPSMNGHHVPVDLRTAIKSFDTFRTLVFECPLVSIPVKFESSGVLERFVACMASQGVEVKK